MSDTGGGSGSFGVGVGFGAEAGGRRDQAGGSAAMIGPRKLRALAHAVFGGLVILIICLGPLLGLFTIFRWNMANGAVLDEILVCGFLFVFAVQIVRRTIRLWTGRHLVGAFGLGAEMTVAEASAADAADGGDGDGGGD